ncbi:hypothetical protein D3C84_1094410 [compost metagenome]
MLRMNAPRLPAGAMPCSYFSGWYPGTGEYGLGPAGSVFSLRGKVGRNTMNSSKDMNNRPSVAGINIIAVCMYSDI